MSRTIAAFTFLAACVAVSAALAQGVPQPAAQPQLNPGQPQHNPQAQPQINPAQPPYNPAQPQYNPAQQPPQYIPTQPQPAQYNPAQLVNPQLQQQLTPDQQQQLERARQAQLQPRPGQPQYDPRFQPAQYQPPAQPGQTQLGQPQPLNPGVAPNGQPGQPGGQPGMPAVQLQPARAPFPPLSPQEEADLDQKLKSWETTSAAVKTFHSEITRWEYDPVWGPPTTAKTEASGIVRFEAPDKGLFQITTAKNFNASTNKYEASIDKSQLEHWVCDGTYVYVVDHKEKKMLKNELPPNMRGTQIADGPLPFVFGQKADKIKARYWIKVSTPPNIKDQIWFEAYPKFQDDARNYSRVDIILDANKLHPLAIQAHSPDPKSKARAVYQFSGQKTNGLFDNNWFRNFIQPDVPSGYKLDEQRFNDQQAQPQQKPLQATVPGGPLKK